MFTIRKFAKFFSFGARLDASLTPEARQVSPFRGMGFRQADSKLGDNPCSSCWRTCMKTKLLICDIHVGGLDPAHAHSLVIQSLGTPKSPG